MPEFEGAVALLRAGAVVCVPTESTYGLAVDAANEGAVETLIALKGRSNTAPFGLIAGDLAQVRAWTKTWPDAAERLAREHWPGALTLVLPPADHVHELLLGPSGGVALRVSSVKLVRDIALALGRPVTATSANPSASPAATELAAARGYFGDRVGLYLDGGECAGPPSTLVDFDAQGRPIVLRGGPIRLPPSQSP